jgi:hypothetical protein
MGCLVNPELEIMWNAVAVAKFKELFWHFPGDT